MSGDEDGPDVSGEGWVRIGRWCRSRRRAVWLRAKVDECGLVEAFELAAGREGCDRHVILPGSGPIPEEQADALRSLLGHHFLVSDMTGMEEACPACGFPSDAEPPPGLRRECPPPLRAERPPQEPR